MAKKPKLKVFTAPIGFHDVYVAAPSRAAALRAWGSDHDLFARGAASEVTEAALAEEPLARPGEVIRRLRGTEAEQFAALPKDTAAGKTVGRRKTASVKPASKPPRPSRKALDAAQAELKAAEARHRKQDDDARKKVEEAQRQRSDLRRHNAAEAEEVAAARDKARELYEHDMARWQDG